MKIVLRLIFAAVIVALAVWLWFIFFPGPEKAVRKQLVKLAGDVSFTQDQSSLIRIAHAENVGSFFTTNVEVIVNAPGHEQHIFAGRAEITQAALQSREAVSFLAVKFPDMNISIAPDKQSATADVTVEVKHNGQKEPFVQEMKFTFEKSQGKWLIRKAETIQPISILNFELRPTHFIICT